jgi:hypothetical protein
MKVWKTEPRLKESEPVTRPKIKLPELEPRHTYFREEVEEYIATHGEQQEDDYSGAVNGFPHKDWKRGPRDVKLWQSGSGRPIVMEYHLYETKRFASWLRVSRKSVLQGFGFRRVDAVREKLTSGDSAFPVWIEKHLADRDPIQVCEGNHRLVAFADLGIPYIPIFLLKYAESR